MKRTFPLIAVLVLAVVWLLGGCGDRQDPGSWLERCGQAAGDYAQGSGYLHFTQESEYHMQTAQGEFSQQLRVEGDIIFTDRETYEYSEVLSSSLQPDQPQENAFSYLTLDAGKTAYVAGERLSAELGVIGWVHYTPQSDQNRYFSYPELIEGITSVGGEQEWVGFEDLGGERCAHLRYNVSGQELMELRLQQDPTFAEQFQGLDMGEIVGELVVELWVGEADDLPRRVVMDQDVTLEDGTHNTTRLVFEFSGYGMETPLLIEAPAFANEAV